MPQYNYVIYHKNCTDGFTGFFILHKSGNIAPDALIYPDIPSAKTCPPNISNKDVIIIDVAYKYEVLKSIIELAKSLTFIDHHITIKDDVDLLTKSNKNIKVVYDLNKSGASLTWNFFYKTPMPKFIKYIEDNDIGKWKYANTRNFIAALDVKYNKSLTTLENLNQWNNLFDNKEVKSLVKTGSIYNEYSMHFVKLNSRRHGIMYFPGPKIYKKFKNSFDKIAQYKVAMYCGGGCPTGSLLGNYMVSNLDVDFVVMWTYSLDRKEYIISFVSKQVDVGQIAKLFNGGGHKLAAACSFSRKLYDLDELFITKPKFKTQPKL